MAEGDAPGDVHEPAWRQRAVSRSLNAARSRAEQRVQRFLDAAFSLIDEKGTTEFTIQEVIDRSKQSLRGFYQYFDGKDELLLALFEETVREATDDLRAVIDSTPDPVERRGRMGVARLEPRARRRRIAEPAADEDLPHDEAHPELALEGEHVGDGTRRDVEPGGHARRTLGTPPDGITEPLRDSAECDGTATDCYARTAFSRRTPSK